MSTGGQALMLARLQALDGTSEEKARVAAWDVARGLFDAAPGLDDGVVARLAELVARRTWLYSWAWRLAVAGGVGFALLVALATIH